MLGPILSLLHISLHGPELGSLIPHSRAFSTNKSNPGKKTPTETLLITSNRNFLYYFFFLLQSHHSGQRSFLKTCPVKAQNCLLIILDPVCAQENSLKARVFEDTESRHWLKHSFMSKFISGK